MEENKKDIRRRIKRYMEENKEIYTEENKEIYGGE